MALSAANPLSESTNSYISYLGTPVVFPVELIGGSYETDKGAVDFQGIVLQDATIDVDGVKTIVETPTNGPYGMVTELVSDGNRVVNIKGVLNSADLKTFPSEKMQRLWEIIKAPVAIDVACEYLNAIGIYSLIIKGHTFPHNGGYINEQPFTLECRENIDLELIERD